MSMASRRPERVTIMAANLVVRGIERIWILLGVMLKKISRPATILPQANREIGLIIEWLLSLMASKGKERGVSIKAKKMIR